MKNLIVRFVKDESGNAAVEYGLIAAGIAVAIVVTIQSLSTKLTANFGSAASALK